MSVAIQDFLRPRKLDLDKKTSTDKYGRFVAEPFERGFGTTIGNAIRRHLISSIHGWAITFVKIDGVFHEFSTIPGVVEDIADIILNVKGIRVKLNTDKPKSMFLSCSGKGVVTAKDIADDPDIEVVNPDAHIATLDKKGKLNIEMVVEKGRGYVPSEKNAKKSVDPQMIAIDSIFSPVINVNFHVENTRVHSSTEYEKLILEVWTDGSILPEDSIAQSAKILKDHLQIFINFDEIEEIKAPVIDENRLKIISNLKKSVDELELSVRSYNCLKNAEIRTISDLVVKTDGEMLRTQNFGRKSLNEIKDILVSMDLKFGMNIEEYKEELSEENK